MTRNEVKSMFGVLNTAYPAFYANKNSSEISAAVDLWAEMFSEDDVNVVKCALYKFIKKSKFPPSISEIKEKIRELEQAANGEPLLEELWVALKTALRNSNYGAREEFEKLPSILQEYYKSPKELIDLAQMSTEKLDTIYHSQFLKNIASFRAREDTKHTMPQNVASIVNTTYTILPEDNNGQNLLP